MITKAVFTPYHWKGKVLVMFDETLTTLYVLDLGELYTAILDSLQEIWT